MEINFSVGYPNGYTELLAGVWFTPRLENASTNTVSSAGSTIQAKVNGMGLEDNLTLLDSSTQTDLCLSSQMLAYSILECELDPNFDFSRTSPEIVLQLKDKKSGQRYDCANNASASCGLTLIATQPTITAASMQSSTSI